MSNHESHCPFLNRADHRCGNHFSLDKLDRAFDHCFGEYHACPTYQEMRRERRERRSGAGGELIAGGAGLTGVTVYANLTVRTRPVHVTVNQVRVSELSSIA
jgi:hypothetical protein